MVTFTYFCSVRRFLLILFFGVVNSLFSQENPYKNPVQTPTQLKVNELVNKIAEYHRLTDGERDGYRIKIHFGVDREAAEAVRTKFTLRFTDYPTYKEYQQPNFVILVGDYRTKLEAFENLKKIQVEFPNAFIVKGKIKVK